ncbi:unnamed protein product [Musa hybrid cultivar]
MGMVRFERSWGFLLSCCCMQSIILLYHLDRISCCDGRRPLDLGGRV